MVFVAIPKPTGSAIYVGRKEVWEVAVARGEGGRGLRCCLLGEATVRIYISQKMWEEMEITKVEEWLCNVCYEILRLQE